MGQQMGIKKEEVKEIFIEVISIMPLMLVIIGAIAIASRLIA